MSTFDPVRHELFKGLRDIPRLPKLEASDVCRCRSCLPSPKVTFMTEPAGVLTEEAQARFREIKLRAPEGVDLLVRTHIGKCSGCSCRRETVGVLVTVEWDGKKMSREYAL